MYSSSKLQFNWSYDDRIEAYVFGSPYEGGGVFTDILVDEYSEVCGEVWYGNSVVPELDRHSFGSYNTKLEAQMAVEKDFIERTIIKGEKEKTNMYRKEITVEQMSDFIRAFSDFTNNAAHDYDDKLSDAFVEAFFQEHRYLQGEMLRFVYKLLGKIGKRAGDKMWTDPRNEYWVSWAKWSNRIDSTGEVDK